MEKTENILKKASELTEEMSSFYAEVLEGKKGLTKEKLKEFQDRLDLLRTLREAEFFINILKDDSKLPSR